MCSVCQMVWNLISCNDRGVELLTFRRRLLILAIDSTSSRHEYHGVMWNWNQHLRRYFSQGLRATHSPVVKRATVETRYRGFLFLGLVFLGRCRRSWRLFLDW